MQHKKQSLEAKYRKDDVERKKEFFGGVDRRTRANQKDGLMRQTLQKESSP